MCWSMSGDTHIKEVINIVEIKLAKYGRSLFKTARSPIKPEYRTELDVSPVFEVNQENYYQTTVGQLRWAVNLGQININLEIALLSCYLYQLAYGNIYQVFHSL